MSDLETQRLDDKRRISQLSSLRQRHTCMNHTSHEIQQMLQELAVESENQDLKMIKSKTKAIIENDTQIYTCRKRLPETKIQHQSQRP